MSSVQVFKTWYRSYTPDGKVWCESSDPAEVVERSEGLGCLFERQVIELVTNPWEPWEPWEPADFKEGTE